MQSLELKVTCLALFFFSPDHLLFLLVSAVSGPPVTRGVPALWGSEKENWYPSTVGTGSIKPILAYG